MARILHERGYNFTTTGEIHITRSPGCLLKGKQWIQIFAFTAQKPFDGVYCKLYIRGYVELQLKWRL